MQVDPIEAAERLQAASILTLSGVKQYSLTLDALSYTEESGEPSIDDLKVQKLVDLHDILELPQLVVYVRTQRESDKLKSALKLKAKHITVASLDENMTERTRDVKRLKFQSGFDNILLVNDEIPNHRGIELVSFERQTLCVINYSLPFSVPIYSKRIGRRIDNYSRKGVAINLLSTAEEERDMIAKLEEFYSTRVTDIGKNSDDAWKDIKYFLRFCP